MTPDYGRLLDAERQMRDRGALYDRNGRVKTLPDPLHVVTSQVDAECTHLWHRIREVAQDPSA
jgi:hypothetical protein